MSKPLRLCFVRDSFAYFSTKSPRKVDGGDWQKRPWWCNASAPYGRGICKVAFDGGYEPNTFNDVSADEINEGCYPWLVSFGENDPKIMAGTEIGEFERLIKRAGGNVYVKHSGINA
jgi:hypothetical protein